MTINTTLRRIGIVIGSLAIASTAFTSTAHAEDASTKAASDCPKGWLCVWTGESYTGRMQKVEGNNADLSQYSVFANGYKSIYNNGKDCDFKAWLGKDYTGESGIIERGYKSTGPYAKKFLSNKWVNCT
ncbi:peptidase inhibitor family I36 protein [Streptomyces violaceus]